MVVVARVVGEEMHVLLVLLLIHELGCFLQTATWGLGSYNYALGLFTQLMDITANVI